jgi:TetR/AcrR family transcriptional regulator, transcriptional repressor for nem operon
MDMGRPRGFDEEEVVRTAVTIFARRPYDAVSVDELVSQLGVHRNSLYKTFGSKRGLYLAALRWYLGHQLQPLLQQIAAAGTGTIADAVRRALDADAELDLLLMATLEQAPVDPEVAQAVSQAWHDFDRAIDPGGGPDSVALTGTIIGLRLRARAGLPTTAAASAVIERLSSRRTPDR